MDTIDKINFVINAVSAMNDYHNNRATVDEIYPLVEPFVECSRPWDDENESICPCCVANYLNLDW